jgi:hypothetical protein
MGGFKVTCAVCGKPFAKRNSLQRVCSPRCALKTVREQRKAEKAEYRRRQEAAKPRSQWLKEAQAVANRYARLRDSHLGCISCDKPASWTGQWHGSHFRSVGAASSIRLNLWNIHKACSVCNHHKSGNIAEYRPRLIEKIGIEKVEWLESQNQLTRYSVEYLKRYKAIFSKKIKRLEERL